MGAASASLARMGVTPVSANRHRLTSADALLTFFMLLFLFGFSYFVVILFLFFRNVGIPLFRYSEIPRYPNPHSTFHSMMPPLSPFWSWAAIWMAVVVTGSKWMVLYLSFSTP